jgi:hypothetical protein
MGTISETVTKTLHGTSGPEQRDAAKKAIDKQTAAQCDERNDLNAQTVKAIAAAIRTGKDGDSLVEKAKIAASAMSATATKTRMPTEDEITAEVGPHAGEELRTVGIMRAQRKIALQGGK